MPDTSSIKISKNSIKFIILQRTEYLQKNSIIKFLNYLERIRVLHNFSVNAKSRLFASKIINEFTEDIRKEYSTIKKVLPFSATSILDIGCGVAGIDILLSRHYNDKIKVFLIDKTHIDRKVYYGFEKRGSFYNSLEIAKKILENNGVESRNIFVQEATDENEIKFKEKFEIVISLISWGFHYPVSVYLDQAYDKLNKDGILILDVRKNTGGEREVEEKFSGFEVILDAKKFLRIVATKK